MNSRGPVHHKFLCFTALTEKADGVWTQFSLLIKLGNYFCENYLVNYLIW